MMKCSNSRKLLPLLALYSFILSGSFAAVHLTIGSLNVTVQNDVIKITFNSDATVSSLIVNGENIISTEKKSFYVDWNNNGQAYFAPSKFTVVENSTSKVDFFWLQESKPDVFCIELHYVMMDGLSGIYSWAKYTNDQLSNVTVEDTRAVYRFNPFILTQATNIVRNEQLYLYAYLKNQTQIQDETWQLPNGTYYTKYDFAGYLRETPYQGVYGNGYGAFVISGSREYHNGGPLRQDLLVHQDSLILNIFVGSHLGTSGLSAPPGWTHIYGPWLIYFNTGNDSDILTDVKDQTEKERNSWPYNFVRDSEYPVKRGVAYGYITGQRKAAVLLHDSTNEDFDTQALGYLYNTETDSTGYFRLENLRPGNYSLVVYPLAGQGSENKVIKPVSITAGDNKYVGTFQLQEPENIIWSIGETSRRSSEFRYSSELRNYVWSTLIPATLLFTIGESDTSNDWYYAQTKPGTWTIQYTDTKDQNSRTLRITLAAASRNPHLIIYFNGYKIMNISFSNDHAIYRSSMQSGTFYSNVLPVKSTLVVSGTNNLTLQITRGQIMYDAISLQKNII